MLPGSHRKSSLDALCGFASEIQLELKPWPKACLCSAGGVEGVESVCMCGRKPTPAYFLCANEFCVLSQALQKV